MIKNSLFNQTKLNLYSTRPKHPLLIKSFSVPSGGKITKSPMRFIGLDLETNCDTGQLRLLGFYENNQYYHYTSNFISCIFNLLKFCSVSNTKIVYWNKLDPFILYKQFLLELDITDQMDSIQRYQKISGKFDKKLKQWEPDNPPLVKISFGDYELGIVQCIKNAYEFFYRKHDSEYLNKIWAYDMALFYKKPLEEIGKTYLPWYSKIGTEVHLLNKKDWERFETDAEFREKVLLSNEYDARAVYELANQLQNDFFEVFHWYPTTFISPGSLTRTAYMAVMTNDHSDIEDEKERSRKVYDELLSIGINSHLDSFRKQLGNTDFKDFISLATECYKGAKIECLGFGVLKEAYLADISGAYVSFAMQLKDFRGVIITKGTGPIPQKANTMTLIRGKVTIPDTILSEYHTILIKHPLNPAMNICAIGTFVVSYYEEEREFLIKLGATFEDETWYQLQFLDSPSPLAKIATTFNNMRFDYLRKGDKKETIAKDCGNSIYGISFEAIMTYLMSFSENTYSENTYYPYKKLLAPYRHKIRFDFLQPELKYMFDKKYNSIASLWQGKQIYPDTAKMELAENGLLLESDHPAEIIREIDEKYRMKQKMVQTYKQQQINENGYRAGDYFNPIIAGWITMHCRLLLSEACIEIVKNGGKIVFLQTDSVAWEGSAENLPLRFWKEQKTVGYFEKPEKVRDLVSLGAGRYEYRKSNEKYVAKKRGLNLTDLLDQTGIVVSDFSWLKALQKNPGKKSIFANVKVLISPPTAMIQKKRNIEDIGRIVKEKREIELFVGKQKRIFNITSNQLWNISKTMVYTKPLYIDYGITGRGIPDYTLPEMRAELQKMTYHNKETKRKILTTRYNQTYYLQNRRRLLDKQLKKYHENA